MAAADARAAAPQGLGPADGGVLVLDSDSEPEVLSASGPPRAATMAGLARQRGERIFQHLLQMGFSTSQVDAVAGRIGTACEVHEDDAAVVSVALDAIEELVQAGKAGDCARKRRRVDLPAAETIAPGLASDEVRQLPRLPEGLVARVRPAFRAHGSGCQPLVHVENVDGCQGRLFAGRVLQELNTAFGFDVRDAASRGRGKRGAVLADHKHPQWHTRPRLSVLQDLADQLLEFLEQQGCPLGLSARPGGRRRGWSDTEVLLYNPGYVVRRHRDAQPRGALLLIFCAGLAGRSLAWPHGRAVDLRLRSGDVLLLDGTATEHAVPEVLSGSSPFPSDRWLGHRRLAVLVRQAPLG